MLGKESLARASTDAIARTGTSPHRNVHAIYVPKLRGMERQKTAHATSTSDTPGVSTPGSQTWRLLLWRRVRHLWLLKMVGTTIAVSCFFILYFWIMKVTAPRAVAVPTMALDRWITPHQWAVLPYGSLWLYVSLAPAFAANLGALRTYVAGAGTIAVLAFATYGIFPTTTTPFETDWSVYPMLQFLKSADAGGNAFPSLHVAFAFYTAVVIASQLKSLRAPRWAQLLNWIWCAAIAYSTLATNQHLALDVLGGVLTTCLALRLIRMERWFALRGRQRIRNPNDAQPLPDSPVRGQSSHSPAKPGTGKS